MAAKKLRLAHPGKILREEFMAPVGLSAYALAKALDVPLPRANDIVREKRAISPEMAVLLSKYFGTSDGYWINLQSHYDLEMAKERVGKQAARIQPHPRDESGALQPI
jgi:addiction module HigA family antidote